MRIAIIGCGNMGVAYARSLRKYDIAKPDELLLITRNEATRAALAGQRIGEVQAGIDARVTGCTIVIIAVKPQDFATIAPALAAVLAPEQIVLSIMAGIPLARLQADLAHRTVVRAMPNSPAQIGMGITAYTTAHELTMRQVITVERLLNSTGRSVHLEDERQLNAVTAISGSGPAYLFHLVRTMIDTGRSFGLEDHVAAALVKQTVLGSIHLIDHSDRSLGELIQAVMSKGGTTEAAFRVFTEGDLAGVLDRGIRAAEARSEALSAS